MVGRTPTLWADGLWFEAYLGGRWYTFDPRNNVPRIGRVLMARGRDAIDVAISTTFGPNTLLSFKVWTDEVKAADLAASGQIATLTADVNEWTPICL